MNNTKHRIDCNSSEKDGKVRPFRIAAKSFVFLIFAILFVSFCVKSFIDTDFSFDFLKHKVAVVNPDTGKSEWIKVWGASDSTKNALRAISKPDFSWKVVKKLLLDMWLTIEIALAGTLIALVFAFPMSFFGSVNLTKGRPLLRFVYAITRIVYLFTYTFPPILFALLFVLLVGVGPFAGVLALAIHSIGGLGKLYSEVIEDIDRKQVEALEAVGAHPLQIVWFGVIPQVLPQMISLSIFRLDMNIRMSIMIGIVGAGGIGFILDQYIKNMAYGKASTAFLIILVAVIILDQASTWFRTRFD
jgi:phosphonate transport system permease protein